MKQSQLEYDVTHAKKNHIRNWYEFYADRERRQTQVQTVL